MKIVISGASGLIGSAAAQRWRREGHEVLRLVRRPVREAAAPDAVHWQPADGRIDTGRLEGADLLLHLAGENLMGLWTTAKKQRIRDSRIRGTRVLSEAVAALPAPPATMLCASAIGYYGSRHDEVLTEESPAGEGFLADTCRQWEAAAAPAAERGVRLVHLRFGLVLSRRGGALRTMLRPFRLGLGGRIGDGTQYMSWITLGDALRAITFAAGTTTLRGPVNLTAPHPVTNSEFTKALGRAIRRPTILPVPAWPLRLLPGDMGREMFLASVRAFPHRLQEAGFHFDHEEIDETLAAELHR
jgi:uncharacterized protein